jgi:integrase
LKMAAPDKTGPVFASRTGGRLSHRNVERRGFDAAAADAGIEGVTLHDLRHAYGSRLASKGLTARLEPFWNLHLVSAGCTPDRESGLQAGLAARRN